MNIILSIRPRYVKEIFEGRKQFEFRKKLCTEEIEKIYIYETAPVSAVVGEVEMKEKLTMPKDELWKVVEKSSGISREEFDNYFDGYAYASAYALGRATVFEKSKSLAEFGVGAAPQSFVYVG